MSLDDRLWCLLLGILIGYFLGRFTRKLDKIENEVHEVDEIVKTNVERRRRNEAGFMRYPVVSDVAVLLTVLLTCFAAFVTQRNSNEVEESQRELASAQQQLEATQVQLTLVTRCTQTYLGSTIEALNERTTYSGDQIRANVEVLKSQAKALQVIVGPPPPTPAAADAATREYIERLIKFFDVNEAQLNRVINTSYPTIQEFSNCLTRDKKE